jgi:hypothetical protein
LFGFGAGRFVSRVAPQELRKSAKRKGHVWSPMTDAFEAILWGSRLSG